MHNTFGRKLRGFGTCETKYESCGEGISVGKKETTCIVFPHILVDRLDVQYMLKVDVLLKSFECY